MPSLRLTASVTHYAESGSVARRDGSAEPASGHPCHQCLRFGPSKTLLLALVNYRTTQYQDGMASKTRTVLHNSHLPDTVVSPLYAANLGIRERFSPDKPSFCQVVSDSSTHQLINFWEDPLLAAGLHSLKAAEPNRSHHLHRP